MQNKCVDGYGLNSAEKLGTGTGTGTDEFQDIWCGYGCVPVYALSALVDRRTESLRIHLGAQKQKKKGSSIFAREF